ncbi:MAG: c-type cytochrome [Kofleriaceae bacterium]
MLRLLLLVAAVLLAAWVTPRHASVRPPQAHPGWALYDRYCLACHGTTGDGRGPAAPYSRSRPRDLTRGDHAWRSTPLGQPPTDEDLRATIRHGAPGTSMPGFDLAPAQLDQLVDLVKAFAPASFAVSGAPIALGPPPPAAPERGAALWTRHGCAGCHGATGTGDTPLARTLARAPYDLTREPLHRPRATDDLTARRRAAALSIATGAGPMPGYAGAMPEAELWALADHVLALAAPAAPAAERHRLAARAIEEDRRAPIQVASWPGAGAPDEAAIFGGPIPPQGPPPASLAPAQASLAPAQCARCHAKQAREWSGSIHARAASPGLAAQMFDLSPERAAACLRCHAPLAEQITDAQLRESGVGCAGCHVRGWTRHGPPEVSPSLLAIPGYPAAPLEIYQRADLCLPCHQLPPRGALEGKPLLDTYREWLEGPYMKRGVQCQHCHMPNREHRFLGIHDAETFRQAIDLTATARTSGAEIAVHAELANVGAGHFLPTTPTPVVWLRVTLLDRTGAPIDAARAELRIGRDLRYTDRWQELSDTRIPPGERATLDHRWRGGRAGEARSARITVEVSPDDYYERLYERQLRGALPAERRRLYEAALARARAAHYTARELVVPIAGR